MGTDIHMYVEIDRGKGWETGDEWDSGHVPYDLQVYTGRNYRLFSRLAGVRRDWDIEPISKLRGIPEDACREVRRLWNDYGEHTPTWLRLDEILNADIEESQAFLDAIRGLPLRYNLDPEKIRLVFWFDS